MSSGTARRALIRPALVAGTASVALLANFAGLLGGVTVVLPHLLYVPIALAGYWYPRRGPLIAAGIAATYGVMALAFAPSEWLSIFARAVTLVAVGALIAYLSSRLAVEEERYRGLFDHSVAGILVVDPDGMVRDANPQGAALVGRAVGEFEGTPFVAVSTDPDAAAAFLDRAAREPIGHAELDLLRADRRPVHCLASGAPLGGGLTLVTLADVTEERMARAALEAANRTMATLAGILDHDLTGDIEALEDCIERSRAAVDTPETIALLRRIGERADGVGRRITVSREFRVLGTRPPAWQPVQAALEGACARLDPGPVAVRAWAGRLEIYADPALPVALYQLLHNATRPGTGATAVVITYRHGPDGCRILVEDDGLGVPPGERDALFSPAAGRYGSGLFLAREILSITGIGIDEDGTCTGARFVLSVPPGGCRVP
ncbi:MAG TPA: PAS domain-containing protein [Methanoregulaceae archaeon]|nr:PAS domain-containing protein [Methanoregulaceae archaeon]